MKSIFLIIILTYTSAYSIAQSETQKISVLLEHFIGEWKGEGWHYHNPDKTNYFIQTCNIEPKLDGQILLVEQTATLKDEPNTVIFCRNFNLEV